MSKVNNIVKSILIILSSVAILFSIGCGENSDSETVSVQLQMGSYTTAWEKLYSTFIPQANAQVSSLKFCFKRLRFKPSDSDTADPTADADNVDFEIGEVDISGGGTTLGSVAIPQNTYKRIEFDLENTCAGGKSIDLTNDSGTYSTADRVTIKFSGSFTAETDGVLTLGVQNILDQLNTYNGTASLKDAAEAISGELSN